MRAKFEGRLQHLPPQKPTRDWPGWAGRGSAQTSTQRRAASSPWGFEKYSHLVPRCLWQKKTCTEVHRREKD